MGDPGFNFLADNFIGGTLFFTDDQVGKYIRALCAQKINGHLTFDQLNVFAKGDPVVLKKFVQDGDGLYYNVRLQNEIYKRSKFSDSQSEKANRRWRKDNAPASTGAMPGHMPGDMPGHQSGICPAYARAIETETDIATGIETEKKKEGMQGGKEKEMQGEEKRKPGSNIPPTVEEVAEYCRSRGNGIDAKKFCDHYEARDWKPKGYTTRMKNWQAAVRTWEPDGFKPNRKKENQGTPKTPPEDIASPEETAAYNPFRHVDGKRNSKGMQSVGEILTEMTGGP